DGRWFDAWLGPSIPFGPYLTDAEWEGVRLVRGWAPDGAKLDSFGMPAVFADPVARRVFNHVSLAFARDTLWVLTRGTASIQGFTIGGQPTGAPLYLPVYHRGMEPRVELGDVNPVTGFRPNELTYHPNVGGVAVGRDSLFVLVRYSRWRLALLGRGWDRWLDYWPTSWIELVDRRGSVVSALEVPGYPIAIATDGEERVAIITDEKDGTRRVLIGRLPCAGPRCRGSGGRARALVDRSPLRAACAPAQPGLHLCGGAVPCAGRGAEHRAVRHHRNRAPSTAPVRLPGRAVRDPGSADRPAGAYAPAFARGATRARRRPARLRVSRQLPDGNRRAARAAVRVGTDQGGRLRRLGGRTRGARRPAGAGPQHHGGRRGGRGGAGRSDRPRAVAAGVWRAAERDRGDASGRGARARGHRGDAPGLLLSDRDRRLLDPARCRAESGRPLAVARRPRPAGVERAGGRGRVS